MIQAFDHVQLRYAHEWHGRVIQIDLGQQASAAGNCPVRAQVLREKGALDWVPMEFLELAPGNEAVLEA